MKKLLHFAVALETFFCNLEERLGIREWFILFRCSVLICPTLTVGLLERKAFLADTPMKEWSAYAPLVAGLVLNHPQTRKVLAWCLHQRWTDPL